MNPESIRISPRQVRALVALLKGPTSREALDRAAGASNGPNVIFRLRQKGFDLPCEMVKGCDRDGKPCKFGIYHLTPADADKAREILREVAR